MSPHSGSRKVAPMALALMVVAFDTPADDMGTDASASYGKVVHEARSLRKRLREQWRARRSPQEREGFLDTASVELTRALFERIIPPWYGTPWSFEGHSETPGSGSVACGYFVSTTLRDVGIRLNRYRLAQQSPRGEARTIAIQDNRFRLYRDTSHAGLESVARRLADGDYFVGLSNHVGFLRKQGSSLRFVHADYVGNVVADQDARESAAFSGESLWVADLTGNRDLARAWLDGRAVEVKR